MDFLVKDPVSVAPTDIIQDTATSRIVCISTDPNGGTLVALGYHGDNLADAFAFVSWALEMDAYTFASNHEN